MEVFKTFATLNLEGNALAKIAEFSKLIDKTSISMTKLQEQLGLVAKDFSVLGAATSREAIGLRAFNKDIGETALKTAALSKEIEALSLGMGRVAKSSAVAGGSLRHVVGSGVRGAEMGALGGFISGGTVATAAAFGLGYAVHSGFKSQEEYQKKQAQLEALGFGSGYMKQVNNLVDSTHIAGVSRMDMMEAVVDAQMATRAGPNQFKEIIAFAPELAKVSMQTGLLFNGMNDKQKKDLIRFAEIQGGSDPNKQMEWLKTGVKMIISSGGTIFPNRQLQLSQLTSGSMSFSPQAYLALEPVLQELQSRTGTGLTTGSRAFNSSGSIPGFSKKALQFWQKSGVFKAEFDKVGQPLGVHMSQDSLSLLAADPDQFMRKVLLPALASQGITSSAGIHTALQANLPRTFGMVVNTLYKNMEKTDRARSMSGHIQSDDELQANLSKRAAFASKNFDAAASNLSLAFGKLSTPVVILGMKALTAYMNYLTWIFGVIGKAGSKFGDELSAFAHVGIGDPGNKNTAQQHGDVYLDGNKVGTVVAKTLAQKLKAGAMSSMSSVSASTSLTPTGLSNYGFQ